MMQIDVGFSPCPNDTFLFYPWSQGCFTIKAKLNAHLKDIQELNLLAQKAHYPFSKVSAATLPLLEKNYLPLSIGATCGHGNGPKIISKSPFEIEDLKNKSIAIPGKNTSAYLLLKRLAPKAKKFLFIPYHQIPCAIQKNEVDCGLIIHETRFTYGQLGFCEIVDLGKLWHKKTQLPLPLGIFVAKKTLEKRILEGFLEHFKKSIYFALDKKQTHHAFILQHSQEKNPTVVQKHIELYVNKESLSLSKKGKEAFHTLLPNYKGSFYP